MKHKNDYITTAKMYKIGKVIYTGSIVLNAYESQGVIALKNEIIKLIIILVDRGELPPLKTLKLYNKVFEVTASKVSSVLALLTA